MIQLGPRLLLLLALLPTASVPDAGARGEAGSPAPPEETIRAWIKAGRYEPADSAATALLSRVESNPPVDSLASVKALDLVVQARTAGSLGNLGDLQLDAERSLRVKRTRLPAGDPEIAVSLTNLGEVLRARGKYGESQAAFREALVIRETAHGPESLETAAALNDVAKSLRDLSRSRESRPLFERALRIRERLLDPNDPDLAISLTNLANVLRDEGELETARVMSERAVAIRRQAFGNDHVFVSRSLQSLAALRRRAGDYAGAREAYDEALAIAQRVLRADHPELARYYTAVGAIAWTTADYEAARVAFETALDIARRNVGSEHPTLTPPLANLGVTALELGDYEASVEYLRAAVANARKTQGARHRATASALNNLGIALHDLGRYAEADSVHGVALEIYEAMDDSSTDVASALLNRAQDAESLGDLPRAVADSRRALAIHERSGGVEAEIPNALENLAWLEAADGRHAEAITTYRRAIEIRRRIFGSDHPLLANPLARQAESLSAVGDANAPSRGALEAESIRRDHLRLTVRSLPERQALRYGEKLVSGLDVAVAVAVTGRSDSLVTAAWDALVRSRALILDEMASRRRERGFRSAEPADVVALRREAADARQRFAGLAARGPADTSPEEYRALLDRLQATSERAERTLLARSSDWREARAREDIGLDVVLGALPRNAAFVSFVRYRAPREGASYAAFVRATDGTRSAVPLGRGGEIDSLILHWRELAGSWPGTDSNAQADEERRLSQALRARIWDPVEARIGAAAHAVIVPDGVLHLVNFGALRRVDSRFLVEAGPTLQLVSTERDLVRAEGSGSRSGGFLALGDPDYDTAESQPGLQGNEALAVAQVTHVSELDRERGPLPCTASLTPSGWDRLPESRREVLTIESLWKELESRSREWGDFQRLTGGDATEEAFKRLAPGKRFLHLATHAYFLSVCSPDAGVPQSRTRGVGGLATGPRSVSEPGVIDPLEESPLLRSGIVLAGANHASARAPQASSGDDGILTAQEIATLDLTGVESAVLSGCDTGVGVIRAGEGVLGLRRAFQIAGARGLVLTLWPINDRIAREWIERYYEARLGRGLEPSDAARQASRTILESRRSAGESVHPYFWAAFITTG